MDVSLWVRFTATERRERAPLTGADRALVRRSMHGTLHHRSGAYAARCRWKVIRRFIMKSGCRSCALAATSSSALGINHRKITHTSTSRWAMPVRSSAPIVLRYSASIRAWAHTKLIRQVAPTVKWTEHGFGPWWRTKCRHHRSPGDERQSCGSSGNFHRSLHALGPCYCLSEHQEDQRTA